MKKYGESVLYTPGPVSVPQRVLSASAMPILHHRTGEFSAILKGLLDKWQWLFATRQPVLPVHTTGRGAMEGVIANLFCKGDSIICVCNGKFGSFFATIAERYGLVAHRVCTDWEAPFDLEAIRAAIAAHPEARAITVCHNESSTAVTIDVPAVARLAREAGMLTLVDAVSSGGCAEINFDAWGVDALVVASQKGLMCPTGMALVILSDEGWKACASADLPKYYTNFLSIRKNMESEKPETPGSTPVSTVYALLESATMMEEEGREALFARHVTVARAVRASLTALGFRLFPENLPEDQRSVSLTAFTPVEGLTANECKEALKRDYGLSIAGGIDHLKGRVLRIGHMGHFYQRDALTFVACLEAMLDSKGLLASPGAGLAACIKALR